MQQQCFLQQQQEEEEDGEAKQFVNKQPAGMACSVDVADGC